MKRCPACKQTYLDDAPDYCSNDGMQLLNEEPGYDPETTMVSSGLRASEGSSPGPREKQEPSVNAPTGSKPPTEWQPSTQQNPQSHQVPGGDPAQQSWPQPQPVQDWNAAPYQTPAPPVNYPVSYLPTQEGRSRALSIAALVTGACAATIMVIWVVRSSDFVFKSMLVLGILGIVLGVASLAVALKKPARFGGVPMAIAGLATGTAALVYYFTL